jgi:excisionase family DNA binding protein
MSEAILNDILTPEEAAMLLKIELKKLLRLIKRGEIPAKRVGRGDYRLKASVIKDWLEDWTPNTFDPNRKAGEILEGINGKKKKRV